VSTTVPTFDVANPATGEVFAQAPECTREQLDAVFAAAAAAQPGWAADPDARKAALLAGSAAIMQDAEEIARLLVAEQGKPLAQAVEEVQGASWWIAHHAKLRLDPEVVHDDERSYVEVRRRPMGVVAAITPWNFPLLLAAWKLGPALSTGNTVVLKPSPYTPLSTLLVVEKLAAALPEGVLAAVTGGNDLGAWMTAHPVPRKVSFTGSIATGRRIHEAVSGDLKRVTLELGGNDAAILLDDIDPGKVAKRVFGAAFMNAGQLCCAVKRVYVPEALHDDVVDALAAIGEAYVVGDGLEPGTQMGPLNNRPHLDRVRGLVDEAVAAGARVATGGSTLDRDGNFYAPTILAGARDGMAIVDEEQFGPALPVIPYSAVEDAVAAANGTSFGLGGSVWGADDDRATEIASRLDCGTAWVNTHAANAPYQPFGGTKLSGVGTENGRWGLEAFTEVQVLHRARR
jgi:acyl-CoA reductase-like NAD-dependent aldehyde dehydrogenase